MMRRLEHYLNPLRDTEGGAGGGSETPAGVTPDTAAGASQPGGADAGAGGASPAGDLYRPEGLPDTMFGDDNKGTIDKLAEAVKGYRDRDANRQVPENADAYKAFDMEAVPEPIRGPMAELAKDPLFDKVAAVALEDGMPVATLQKLTTALYEAGHEAGMLDDYVDTAKEREALLPSDAAGKPQDQQDAAIDARLQANVDFLGLLAKNSVDEAGNPVDGGLSTDDAKHAELMLLDTAAGNRFLEFFRSKVQGMDKAQPNLGDGGGQGGTSARDALKAELAKPEMQPDHPMFSREKYDELMGQYRKVIGN